MEINDLSSMLKRYSFEHKMNICSKESGHLMTVNGIRLMDKKRKVIYPWLLESFALFSIMADKEYQFKSFASKKDLRIFYRMINVIFDCQPSLLEKSFQNKKDPVSGIMITHGLTQFEIQRNIFLKLYRYHYFFNFNSDSFNLKQIFSEKLESEYQEFMEFGFLIHFIFSEDVRYKYSNINEFFHFILLKYQSVVNSLMIDRKILIEKQQFVTPKIEDYIYGYKYFAETPFVKNNENIYLPLPHLIIESVTSSLLKRVTANDDNTRELFGLETLEKYLIHLCKFQHADELITEQKYNVKRNERRTADIMMKKGNQCLLFESKGMSPRNNLRLLNEDSLDFTEKRLVGYVVQVYKHVTIRFQKEYNFFESKEVIRAKDIFGAVIVYEDTYYSRRRVMEKAAETLKLKTNSLEFNYLCSNIKILSLSEVEDFIFQKIDLFRTFTENSLSPEKWFDFSMGAMLIQQHRPLKENEELSAFIDEIKISLKSTMVEFEKLTQNKINKKY